MTEEHKRKISLALTGRVFSEEHRRNNSVSKIGKMMGNENPSKRPDVRQKISEALKGKKKKYPAWNKGLKIAAERPKKVRPKKQKIVKQKKKRVRVILLLTEEEKRAKIEASRIKRRAAMLGKKIHSEEWKQKLRERMTGNTFNLGKKASPESIEKRAVKLREKKYPGRTLTKEHKKRIGLSKVGKKRAEFSKEWRENISKSHLGKFIGSKSSSWKGGVTNLRHLIRSSYKYKEWRTSCFIRDKYTCLRCGKKGGILQVHHHPKPFKEILHGFNINSLESAYNCSDFWDLNNGITLCITCHTKTESWGRPLKKTI